MSPGRHIRLWLAAFLPLLLAGACSRPVSTETFIKASRSRDGVYAFPAALTDSLALYDLYLFARMDCNVWQFRDFDGVSLALEWISPSAEAYADTVFLRPGDVTHSTFFTQDFRVLYRSDVAPKECGDWTIRVEPIGEDSLWVGLRGLGLQVIRKDGTR